MRYELIGCPAFSDGRLTKGLDNEKFRRLAGVKRTTFDKMVSILEQSDKNKKVKGGRKNKLSIKDMLLMTLEYIRKYRTYFHVSESTAYKTVRWIEGTLIKHPDHPMINVVTDTRYQGLQKIHARTQMPKKRNQKHPLTKEDKKNNQLLNVCEPE